MNHMLFSAMRRLFMHLPVIYQITGDKSKQIKFDGSGCNGDFVQIVQKEGIFFNFWFNKAAAITVNNIKDIHERICGIRDLNTENGGNCFS